MAQAAPGVRLVVHGALEDHLAPTRRGRPVVLSVPGHAAVRDVIESVGIPHVEVDAILAGDRWVGFGHRVRAGDTVEIYPLDWPGQPHGVRHLVPPGPRGPSARFVLDGHLGRLAAYLRMLGFDTLYAPQADDAALATVSAAQDRVLLTRDRGLLKRSIVHAGYYLRSDRPGRQLGEVLARYRLADAVRPFTRCMRCNALLQPIATDAARQRVPARVAQEQTQFRLCAQCDAVYWPGSHHARMQRLIDGVLAEAASRSERHVPPETRSGPPGSAP